MGKKQIIILTIMILIITTIKKKKELVMGTQMKLPFIWHYSLKLLIIIVIWTEYNTATTPPKRAANHQKTKIKFIGIELLIKQCSG